MSFAPQAQNNTPIITPAAGGNPAPPPPIQFPPLYEQGRINQPPASPEPDPSQGLASFAQGGQPNQNPFGQTQIPPQGVDMNALLAMIGQGVQPGGLSPQGAMPPPPPTYDPAPPAPQIDQNLLNDAVVNERLRGIEMQYAAAYQQAQHPQVQQAILLAYHGERAKLEGEARAARAEWASYQTQRQFEAQRQQQEPVYRMLAAQHLAQRLGIGDINQVLRTPWGQEIWEPQQMLLNAMHIAGVSAQQNVQQAATRGIAPVPTGGQQGADFSNFTRSASREDFLRVVDQAKRAGVRLVSG